MTTRVAASPRGFASRRLLLQKRRDGFHERLEVGPVRGRHVHRLEVEASLQAVELGRRGEAGSVEAGDVEHEGLGDVRRCEGEVARGRREEEGRAAARAREEVLDVAGARSLRRGRRRRRRLGLLGAIDRRIFLGGDRGCVRHRRDDGRRFDLGVHRRRRALRAALVHLRGGLGVASGGASQPRRDARPAPRRHPSAVRRAERCRRVDDDASSRAGGVTTGPDARLGDDGGRAGGACHRRARHRLRLPAASEVRAGECRRFDIG